MNLLIVAPPQTYDDSLLEDNFGCHTTDRLLASAALQPRLDLVALDLAGGAARQVGEGDEADVLGLLVAGELARGIWRRARRR